MNPAMLYVKQNASVVGRLRRFGVPVLAFTLLVVIGRQFTPRTSMANIQADAGLPAGSLVGETYLVELVVTSMGPRFNVRSSSGRLLAAQLDKDQLAREFPQLDLKNATAGTLMTAEQHQPQD